jgi:shikimate dehydrogenase
VLGQPVAHSLSPVLHRAGYRALGLHHWRYAAHELGVAELPSWVAGLDDSWRGLSLTMPLKEAVFAVTADATETAGRTGSINTLVRADDGTWTGHNTDVAGLVAALGDVDHGGTATVLGSGATSRSAIAALAQLGVQRVRLAARTQRPGAMGCAADYGLEVESVPLGDWTRERTGLVISTLPPGPSAEIGGLLTGSGARFDGVTLLDVVYADWPTPLARAGQLSGMTVLSGLEMLVHQAAEQFRLFTGQAAPVEAMYAAGREALHR